MGYLYVNDNLSGNFAWSVLTPALTIPTSTNQVALVENSASLNLIPGGSGYTAPTVTITPVDGNVTTVATATATVSPSGVITAIVFGGGGSGYTAPPTVAFSGGSGSGATATAILGTGATAGQVVGYTATQASSASGTVTFKMQNIQINNTA